MPAARKHNHHKASHPSGGDRPDRLESEKGRVKFLSFYSGNSSDIFLKDGVAAQERVEPNKETRNGITASSLF